MKLEAISNESNEIVDNKCDLDIGGGGLDKMDNGNKIGEIDHRTFEKDSVTSFRPMAISPTILIDDAIGAVANKTAGTDEIDSGGYLRKRVSDGGNIVHFYDEVVSADVSSNAGGGISGIVRRFIGETIGGDNNAKNIGDDPVLRSFRRLDSMSGATTLTSSGSNLGIRPRCGRSCTLCVHLIDDPLISTTKDTKTTKIMSKPSAAVPLQSLSKFNTSMRETKHKVDGDTAGVHPSLFSKLVFNQSGGSMSLEATNNQSGGSVKPEVTETDEIEGKKFRRIATPGSLHLHPRLSRKYATAENGG